MVNPEESVVNKVLPWSRKNKITKNRQMKSFIFTTKMTHFDP